MSVRVYSERKVEYSQRMLRYLNEFSGIMLVNVDFVGSNQLQQIRQAVRGRAEMLFGKNTMMRRILREAMESKPEFESLLPYLKNNVGLIFTNESLKEIREVVQSFRVPASAKTGVIAPIDVWVPAGPTGCDPGQTSFFQALNIGTKIVKGAIEIIVPVHLVKKGTKIGSSEVALLNKLEIRPFTFGLDVTFIYENGSIYAAEVMDITEADLLGKFANAVSKIAALGLQIRYPTLATIPHSIATAFKKILSISLSTDYTFEQAQKFKDYLENPEAFAPAATVAAPAEQAAEPEEEESEEESEADFDLFD